MLHKDTTFVPLRFVSEALGATVTWTEATKAIDIEPQVEPAPPPGAEKVIVKRVVDGGTVELEDGRQVRLIGVFSRVPTVGMRQIPRVYSNLSV